MHHPCNEAGRPARALKGTCGQGVGNLTSFSSLGTCCVPLDLPLAFSGPLSPHLSSPRASDAILWLFYLGASSGLVPPSVRVLGPPLGQDGVLGGDLGATEGGLWVYLST